MSLSADSLVPLRLIFQIEKLHLNDPYKSMFFKIRIGGKYFVSQSFANIGCHPYPLVGLKFLFLISLHSYIFDFLHIDLFQAGFFKSLHVGRVSLKLSHLANLPSAFTSWFEVLDPQRDSKDIFIPKGSSYDFCTKGALEIRFTFNAPDLNFIADSVNISFLHRPMVKGHMSPTISPTQEAIEEEDSDALLANKQLNYLCCMSLLSPFISANKSKAIDDIEHMLAAFGQGLDISRSQIGLSVLLISQFYEKIPRTRSFKFVTSVPFLNNIAHIMKYAFAVFGWRGINFMGKGRGSFYGISLDISLLFFPSSVLDFFRFDADRKSIIEYLQIDSADFLQKYLVSSELYTPCYCIFRDRTSNAIVLSIRGTMDFNDTVTDLACEYIAYKNGLVHSGIFQGASFLVANVLPVVSEYKTTYGCDKIIITGHSLGAATAAMMGLLINQTRDDVFCYCFGCPAIISIELLPLSQKNIFSFNYDQDIVGKLSYGSVMDFRVMVLVASRFVSWEAFFSGHNPRLPEAMQALTSCREELNRLKQHPRLMAAGQYYQIYKLSRIGVPADYRDDQFFIDGIKLTVMELSESNKHNELMITRDLLLDHIPSRYDIGLERCIKTIERKLHPFIMDEAAPSTPTTSLNDQKSDTTINLSAL